MMEYAGLIFLLVSCLVLQIGLSYFQQRSYHRVLNQMKERSDGYLGVGVARAKFKLGAGVISVLVTDINGFILDYREMSGVSVFARFKQKQQLIGKSVSAVQNDLKGKQRTNAFQQAASLIKQEILKTEGI